MLFRSVLETRLLPGRESMIDCALFLGSSAGRFDEALRAVVTDVRAGRVRCERDGRRRAAPTESALAIATQLARDMFGFGRVTHRSQSLPSGTPLCNEDEIRAGLASD